ncbi:MAG: amidohydrolase [Kordiimonadaceae bacterium]|nr:amidohydrolase [Kordiimonadaceae bacterium]MBT6036132.1 amidohydrolase [Kordiimonadaceae bacterium]MBT6329887.1 amidohydrolase [Kordiimonadaceae bacterium]
MINKVGLLLFSILLISSCAERETVQQKVMADTILDNGKLYSFSWAEPSVEGVPASDAPYNNGVWTPDGEAVAIKDGSIIAVGTSVEMMTYKGVDTEIVDLNGAYILPGLVDSHTHIEELGATFENVDLFGVETEEEAAGRVVDYIKANNIPKGEWIVARGYDEGKWADKNPTYKIISEMVPDNPVYMDGSTGFSAYGNKLAMIEAGITRDAENPTGGIIHRDENGEPTGRVSNRGVTLYRNAIPELSQDRWKRRLGNGLDAMAKSGFTTVHQAGAHTPMMDAFQAMEQEGSLPIRVYAMISGRDKPQMESWKKTGPAKYESNMLFVNSVKGYYDGSLGARGAKLLEEYSDSPGTIGVSGEDYGFFVNEIGSMVQAGFQVNVHAIGDGGNREVLHFFRDNFAINPELQKNRHRIEHAQVVHADDFKLYDDLDIIAAVQPPFVAEDKLWTVDRVGAERAKGAYAWRTFRRNNVPLAFGSDLMGYDWNVFYGLHSAITRKSKDLEDGEGWYPDEKLSAEEAVRGYTTGAAYAAFLEKDTGTLEAGKWADITVVDMDVLNVGENVPAELFKGKVLMTIVGGNIVYQQ